MLSICNYVRLCTEFEAVQIAAAACLPAACCLKKLAMLLLHIYMCIACQCVDSRQSTAIWASAGAGVKHCPGMLMELPAVCV